MPIRPPPKVTRFVTDNRTDRGARKDGGLSLDQNRKQFSFLAGEDVHLRIATVKRVDSENMLVDVEFEDKPGGRLEIPIAPMGGSQRAHAIVVPEENSVVLLGFARYQGVIQKPFILAQLVAQPRSKINFSPYKAQKTGEPKLRRYRGRKLYQGDVYLGSNEGSEIHLDEDIFIEDRSYTTVRFRSDDGSISSRALQHFSVDAAIRSWSGLIVRDDFHFINPTLNILEEGLEGPDIKIVKSGLPYVRKSSGRKKVHVCMGKGTIDEDKPFVEARFSVEEYADAKRPIIVAELDDFDFQITNPTWRIEKHQLFELNTGTLVGDDPVYEEGRYGHVLVPQLFMAEKIPWEGNPLQLDRPDIDTQSYEEGRGWLPDADKYLIEEILPLEGDPRKTTTAAMVRFRARNKKSHYFHFSISKEGKVIAHLGRSGIYDPLGEDRSLEFASEGSLKLVIGRNKNQKHSIWLSTRGGVVSHIGDTADVHNERKDRSKQLYRDGQVYGQHGYHDLIKLALHAPMNEGTVNNDPQFEAYSVDTVVNRNIHMIVGWDSIRGAGDHKSITLDTRGSIVMALGKDKWNHSLVLGTDGSIEAQIGKNIKDARSINLDCLGGVQIHVDAGDSHKGQSLHMELAKGMEIEINNGDNAGDGFTLKIRGNVNIQAQGKKIKASLAASETIFESCFAPTITRVITGEYTELIFGNYKQLVVGNRLFTTTGAKVYS